MEIKQIQSEAVPTGPRNAQELYDRMTATALDFRALSAPEDWHNELWDMVPDVRKLIPASARVPSDVGREMTPQVMANLRTMGIGMKSPSTIARESNQLRAHIESLYKRLRQIRQNAWFDIRIETVEEKEYRANHERESRTMVRRLKIVDDAMPTTESSVKVLKAYLKLQAFWLALERPSVLEERMESLDVMSEFRMLHERVSRCYDERDRVIFLWEEPNLEWSEAEKQKFRAGVLQELKDMGADVSDIE